MHGDRLANASTMRVNQDIDIDKHIVGEPKQPDFNWSAVSQDHWDSIHPHLSYGLKDMFRSAIAVDNRSPYHFRQRNALLPVMRRNQGSKTMPDPSVA